MNCHVLVASERLEPKYHTVSDIKTALDQRWFLTLRLTYAPAMLAARHVFPLALRVRHSYYIEIAGDATEVCSNIRIHFDVRCKEDIFG
jgi:hypothetical protein